MIMLLACRKLLARPTDSNRTGHLISGKYLLWVSEDSHDFSATEDIKMITVFARFCTSFRNLIKGLWLFDGGCALSEIHGFCVSTKVSSCDLRPWSRVGFLARKMSSASVA